MSKLHALIIGINNYAEGSEVTPLSGCVNDATNVATFLKKHFKNCAIKKLLNEKATRKNIITTFQNHLIKKYLLSEPFSYPSAFTKVRKNPTNLSRDADKSIGTSFLLLPPLSSGLMGFGGRREKEEEERGGAKETKKNGEDDWRGIMG